MATHVDALKRARQADVARLRNKHYKTQMRNQLKKFREAVAAKNLAAAQALLPDTVSLLQRLAQKGVIHKRNASRHVSRLSIALNTLKPVPAKTE